MNTKVSYEVYANDGRLVDEKKLNCSDTWELILDDGKYSVEATIDGGKGEAEFTVGNGKPTKLILDLTNLNHEEEIKADSPDAVVVPVKPKKQDDAKEGTDKQTDTQSISIGDKKIEVKGISKEDADKLKNLGAMLGALGGMMQGGSAKADKEAKAKQDSQNAEADKEFDEMSKDLDMYSK
ncbi:MAG TPA: hypothetical protein ENL02_02350 [Epsilonproteobacteria bacterium]|nr:hypothetical protein [Campylobacterota bacterium]